MLEKQISKTSFIIIITCRNEKYRKYQKKKRFIYSNYFTINIKENNNIRLDRKKLFSILNKSKNTKDEKNG